MSKITDIERVQTYDLIVMDAKEARIRGILAEIKPLAVEYYDLTKRPLGVTGEIAEFVAAEKLGLRLAEARNVGYDALRGPQKIQIKGRTCGRDAKPGQRLSRIKLDADCDVVLLVLLDSVDLDPKEMWEAPYSEVCDRLRLPGSRARNVRGALSVNSFKHLPGAHKVWPVLSETNPHSAP